MISKSSGKDWTGFQRMYIVEAAAAEQATAGQTVPIRSVASKKELTSATSAPSFHVKH